jgi:7-cyano-7-deazaguanine synthase
MSKKHVVVSLSGGMDSSTLLLRCLKDYDTVTAISFDYGQKHRVELERAQSLVNYLNGNVERTEQDQLGTITVVGKNFNPINYRQIKLDGLVDLLDSALVTGGEDVPEGHYAEDNMKATVVPNRNKIFASITQAVALSVANRTGENCDIAMGIHAGDHAIYPDCRQEFRDADDAAFRMGNWDAERVGYFTPYLEGDKFTILQDGEVLCKDLGLDFDEVYKRTNTSYKPIWIPAPINQEWLRKELLNGHAEKDLIKTHEHYEGEWYSDYKSASSVERVEAFIKVGRLDPAPYADETGPVTWEHVVAEVTKVLDNHKQPDPNVIKWVETRTF